MRFALLPVIFVTACGSSGKSSPDAKQLDAPPVAIDAPMIDAPMIDAMVDAPPPDAPVPMNIVLACMHACDKFATCAGEPPDTSCYAECGEDLGDCTTQQVMDVDTCSQLACGTDGEAIIMCLEAITCVMG